MYLNVIIKDVNIAVIIFRVIFFYSTKGNENKIRYCLRRPQTASRETFRFLFERERDDQREEASAIYRQGFKNIILIL